MDTDQDKMITPCQCEGSMKYVHDFCLYDWIKNSNREVKTNNTHMGVFYVTTCEICHNSIRFQLVYRNSFARGLYKVTKNTLQSVRSFSLFTFVNISIYFIYFRIKLFSRELNDHYVNSYRDLDSTNTLHHFMFLIGLGTIVNDVIKYYRNLFHSKRKAKVKFIEREKI
jgi:hypothetical protein